MTINMYIYTPISFFRLENLFPVCRTCLVSLTIKKTFAPVALGIPHALAGLKNSRLAACFWKRFSFLDIVLPLGPPKKHFDIPSIEEVFWGHQRNFWQVSWSNAFPFRLESLRDKWLSSSKRKDPNITALKSKMGFADPSLPPSLYHP